MSLSVAISYPAGELPAFTKASSTIHWLKTLPLSLPILYFRYRSYYAIEAAQLRVRVVVDRVSACNDKVQPSSELVVILIRAAHASPEHPPGQRGLKG